MKTTRRPDEHSDDQPRSTTVSTLEGLLDLVLQEGRSADSPDSKRGKITEGVRGFSTRNKRVVVLGGGTGMSTIVGGNSQLPGWISRPFVGLKSEFGRVDVIACTTDDGGSTGELLKYLPMIGIGDLRKSCVSMIRAANLRRACGTADGSVTAVLGVIRHIFSYRFPARGPDRRILEDPLRCVPPTLRVSCPARLRAGLNVLGRSLAPVVRRLGMSLAGHSLGNLLLTAAIFREAGGRMNKPPSEKAVQRGLDHVARLIGASPGCLHAATSTAGQLSFRYANGVEVYGQSKAGTARRDVPVAWVRTSYAGAPTISAAILGAIRRADVIVCAPGSLYSSMIPVLQLPGIVHAIRSNRKALKILAANFWIQEGETDISLRDEARGFYVSDLLEAYNLNVQGGARGLFDVVLCSNLEHLPGHILRSYALEGKHPIHLNRARVEDMGFLPVEATLFSSDKLSHAGVIHHDAGRFALAVRTFMYLREHRNLLKGWDRAAAAPRRGPSAVRAPSPGTNGVVLCAYREAVRRALSSKKFHPSLLRDVLLDLAWENRDIQPAHLGFFREVRVIADREWSRSVEWDNVLGYYDPADRSLKLHAQLLRDPFRLRRDLLIAMGESLLGRYIESRRWVDGMDGARRFEIRLRKPEQRSCWLGDRELRRYLRLARMVPDRSDRDFFRITVNDDEGFLPPGLLFGLLYAWYLNNTYGGVMEYEMSLLRWPEERLVPYQAKERRRKDALVRFFREVVFGHG